MDFSEVEEFINKWVPRKEGYYYFKVNVEGENMEVSDIDLHAILNSYLHGPLVEADVVKYLVIGAVNKSREVDDYFDVDGFLEYRPKSRVAAIANNDTTKQTLQVAI